MEEVAEKGSEPMRNMFSCARELFCREPGLVELAASIAEFPKDEAPAKKLRYYCTMNMYYTYFWRACKPEGYSRHYVANGMVFSLYRLILLENEILFPSSRKLETTVIGAANKPDRVIELCHRFLHTLQDEDALQILTSYENWTTYDYPKDRGVILNNFRDHYEWK